VKSSKTFVLCLSVFIWDAIKSWGIETFYDVEIIQLSWISFCPDFVSLFLFLTSYTPTMKLINFIFPRHCIACWQQGEYLCKSCKKQLQPHPEICPYCHRVSKDYTTCIECRCNKNNNLEGIIIPFAYTTLLKKLIIKLKYFHKKDIGEFLVERLTIALQANQSFQRKFNICPPLSKEGWCVAQEDLSRATRNPSSVNTDTSPFSKGRQNKKISTLLISFIPSHRYRHYFVKWYNQSELLAKKLSKKLHVPMVVLARKQKHTKTQASLDRNGRLYNLKNAFSLIQNLNLFGNETMLIVDDITTTWSTINELAKLIKFHYPDIKVRWAVLWRHIW